MYHVVVSPEVAAIGDGTRRRDGRIFSRTPTILNDDELTDAIERDPHLIKKHITEGGRAKGKKAAQAAPPPTGASADLEALSYQDLKKLAASLELDAEGKKADLIERIAAHRAGAAGEQEPPGE